MAADPPPIRLAELVNAVDGVVCCGAPLLVLVFLGAAGGAPLGANTGILWVLLPILALFACPLAMLLLMRGMRPGAKRERDADAPSAAAGQRREN